MIMTGGLRSGMTKKEEPSRMGRFFRFANHQQKGQQGNALLYVLLAVGLLAALTFYFVQDSNENYATQDAIHISEELYAQVNTIRSAISECTLDYPNGGPDVNGDGLISSSENPNNPYPIDPLSPNVTYETAGCSKTSNAANCIIASTNDDVGNLSCPGAGIGYEWLFSGTNNQGRYLPPTPNGFSAWTYSNTSSGVSISITAPSDVAANDALTRLLSKFTSGQASISGQVFTIYLKQ